MAVILIVNGALDWRPHFPGDTVVQTQLARSRWLLERGTLWVQDPRGTHRPDVVLWRLGAVDPHPTHRARLQMLRMAGVSCVNTADALLQGYDRLNMLYLLRQAGLPIQAFDVYAGPEAAALTAPEMPCVLKVGNLHGGRGKACARTPEQWEELMALAELGDLGYATVEPFIDYARDLRCMAVGDRLWAMERASAGWKANVGTTSHELVEVPGEVAQWTRAAARVTGAEVLGVDFLQTREGAWVALESNDVPGVRGWPGAVLEAIAGLVRARLNR